MSNTKKALLFYTYLPPWRIDVFNAISEYYNLTIVFTNVDAQGFVYDTESLKAKLSAKVVILKKGLKVGKWIFRFGILRLIRNEKPDVVFAHEYSPISTLLTSLRILGFFERLFITTSDNLDMAFACKGLKRFVRNWVLRNADGVIVYTPEVADYYRKKTPAKRVEVCPNIQDESRLLQLSDEIRPIAERHLSEYRLKEKKIILYVGRLSKEKGLAELINAFSKVVEKDWCLVIVGKGEERDNLERLTNELGLSENVIFAGFYTGCELYAWYTLANIFILPSLHEPFGAVVNEALVFGCPVMLSKFVGARFYVKEGENGTVFDPRDDDEFQYSLQGAMIKYSKTRHELGSEMIRKFEDYIQVFRTVGYDYEV